MLDINKINDEAVYGKAWKVIKGGKFSASTNHKLFSENSHKGVFTEAAITHIENIAGEVITGKATREEFFTDATNYGNAEEPNAIKRATEIIGKPVFRNANRGDTHRLITHTKYQVCTPDALIAMASEKYIFNPEKTHLKVAPLEVKCPPVHHRFIKLYKCFTPQDLKKTDKSYYYQVLTQLVYCDALIGYFGAYNFNFTDNIRVITFKQTELKDEIVKFNQTMAHAEAELIRTINLFKK